MKHRIRLKITGLMGVHGNVDYIEIVDGKVQMLGKDGTPMSLSYLAADAVALRWALEDAGTGADAAKVVRKALGPSSSAKVEWL